MTHPGLSPLSCEAFADGLADFLEREVDEATGARMEAHALSCDDCGPLLADLRSLRIDAANLPELTPSRDLWEGISARIETPVVALRGGAAVGGTAERQNGRTRASGRVWLGLAAAGLIAVTATITHELTKRSIVAPGATVAAVPTKPVSNGDTAIPASPATRSPVAPAATAKPKQQLATTEPATTKDSVPPFSRSTVQPAPATASPALHLASDRPSAQQTYDSEIARLRIVVNRRRDQLDSTTIATIENNLLVIDKAIEQCKQALRKDPASGFLMESLNEALDNKVQLLRTAATLPSKM